MPTAKLTIDQDRYEVEPGKTTSLLATLKNEDAIVHAYELKIRGDISPEWVEITPRRVNLLPEESSSIRVTLSPPQESATKPGDYELILVALLVDESPLEDAPAAVTLEIKSFTIVESRLEPDLIRSGQRTALAITNKGNSPQSYLLKGHGDANFKFLKGGRKSRQARQLEVDPGQTESVDVRVDARRPWFRPVEEADIPELEIQIHSEDSEEPRKEAVNLIIEPRLSIWPILLLLMILCSVSTAWVWLRAGPTPTPTPAPAPAPPVASQITPSPEVTATATSTPPPPDVILKFTSIPNPRIIQGECVTLTWYNLGPLESIFLNDIDVTGKNSYEDCPDATITYTLLGRRSSTDPDPKTDKSTITVDQPKPKVIYPPAYSSNYILNGDELAAQGVRFTIEDKLISSNCKSSRPAVGIAVNQKAGRYFTTFVPKLVPVCEDCAPELCKSVPLSIHFLEPRVKTATVYFLNPTNAHQGIITTVDNSSKTVKAPQNISYYATYTKNDKTGGETVERIDVGVNDPSQPPAVVRIEYEYLP